jgi:adenylate/guanylate cyclase family protein
VQRKVVTVVFCDVVGSTSLGESVDPEALQALLARYFERMKAIVENHGGTVEKFIGDAIMAVFGVPVVREDDALRAVRVAEEMQLPWASSSSRAGSASIPGRSSPGRRSGWSPATPSMSPPGCSRRPRRARSSSARRRTSSSPTPCT